MLREGCCAMANWKLLHLISSDRWTGAAEPVCNLVRGLQSRGHHVRLGLIRGKSFEPRARERGIEIDESLHLHRGFNPLKSLADIRSIARTVRSDGIDLIHCHMNTDHWLAAFARKMHRLDVRLVRTQHRVRGLHRELGAGLLCKRLTDAVIVLGDERRHEEIRAGRVRDDQVHVIRGAVDSERVHPGVSGAAVRADLGIPADAPVVGMIAHFKTGRGWSTATEAFVHVHRRNPNAHFLLAGGHSSLVKRMRAQLESGDCLAQTHFVSDNRLPWPEVIAAMDFSVWLAPGSEGSARAVIEVMAAGRPVIAGDLGTIRETLENAVSGTIVSQRVTPETLARAISHLIEHPTERLMMGRAARKRIEAQFTIERQVDDVEALYARLIG
jgi:glycosyltransferase involved in cell wall biosynthesis